MTSKISFHKSATRDMTSGSIAAQVILFALPLMLGNVFQMLYNTVDSIVVGNFVGTEALAAVGSTTMITSMAVNFFNGFSVGVGVVIGFHFGSRNTEKLHAAVETAMCATFIFSAVFTVGGLLLVYPMLRFMSTPDDVMEPAALYIRIYMAGISGLLIYNIGSGILRAVGDSTRPLIFLVITSLLNIILDVVFVIVFHWGIAGVAWATVIAQFISACLVLILLTRTKEIYKLTWHDLKLDLSILKRIFAVGLPAGIQSVITAFSNVFVQSYVNSFGSACMAGWSSYNKLDQFIMLPMKSMAMSATTFVSQNMGAGQEKRANQGTVATTAIAAGVTAVIAAVLWVFASSAVRLFTTDENVVSFGSLFLRTNVFFLICNCINHVLAGALRGRGDAKGPMIIMLSCFVGVRQVYLYLVTHFVANTPMLVGIGYPVGWVSCCIVELIYFFLRWNRNQGILTD